MKESIYKREKNSRLWYVAAIMYIMLSSLSSPQGVLAQELSEKRVSITLKNASIYDFFEQVKQQTGLNVMVNSSLEISKMHVTIKSKNKLLNEVLDEVTTQVGCSYEIEDGFITLLPIYTGKHTVSGYVYDNENQVLPGTFINIKGTTKYAETQPNGFYSIDVPNTSCTLVFSMVGMKDYELQIGGGKGMVSHDIILNSAMSIDEAVITGYQTIDKRKVTSAITSIKTKDILRPGLSSIDQMLEGQIPDLMLTSNSGEVGTVPRIRIRGTSTLIGNREPLWILDGVILQNAVNVSPEELNNPDYINRIGNAISGINPQDIDRIDVLKDAAATALYGAKAANGVIVITTKKGHIGKPIITYNMNMTLRTRPRYTDRKIDLMNSKERVDFSRYLFRNGYTYGASANIIGYEGLMQKYYSGAISFEEYSSQVQQLESNNTDWFGILTNDAISNHHSISISGGSKDVRYYSSIGYDKENDVIKTNGTERYSVSLNIDARLNSRISAKMSVMGSANNRKYIPDEIAPMNYAYNINRSIPAYNPDGSYYYYSRSATSINSFQYNILNEIDNSSNEQKGNNLNVSLTLNGKIADYLNLSVIGSYQTSNTTLSTWWGEKSFHAASLRTTEYGVTPIIGEKSQSTLPFGGELTTSKYLNTSYTVRTQLDFNKNFGKEKKHNIISSIGLELNSNKYEGNTNVSRGYYKDRGKQFSVTSLADYPAYASWIEQNAYPNIIDNLTNLFSGYATVSYTYRQLFTLNANMRLDGSNKFGDRSNEKLLPIWSVSGNYNISEHSFLQRDYIDYITLKASYGFQGNIIDGQSPQMIIKQQPIDPVYGELVSELQVYPNPNLRWEKTSSFNAGLEFALFRHRLQVELSGYYKKTHDAFLTRDISSVNGVSQYVVNSGDITNIGYSVAVTAVPLRVSDFNWIVSTSISKVNTTLNTLPGQDQYELNDYLNGTALIDGKPIGTFYSYKFIGLNPTNGYPIFDDKREHMDELVGLSKYDLYTSVLECSGSREPTISGSINNTITYKNWRLNAMLSYSLGSKVRMFKLFPNGYAPENNVSKDFLKMWKNPGDEKNTNIPNPICNETHWSSGVDGLSSIASFTWDMYNYGSQRVVSGNYLSFSTLSLTYEFSQKILKKVGLSRLALNLAGNNLYTICSKELKGQTPRQSGFSDVQLADRPSFTLGLNISF